jgi:hypothetical protein
VTRTDDDFPNITAYINAHVDEARKADAAPDAVYKAMLRIREATVRILQRKSRMFRRVGRRLRRG